MGEHRRRLAFWAGFIALFCLMAGVVAGTTFYTSKNAEKENGKIQLYLADSLFGNESVRIYGAEIDGEFISAKNIFGDLPYENDDSLILMPENIGEHGVSGTLPSGIKQELVFERANYRGDIICRYQGNSFHISTYGGYWEQMHFNLTPGDDNFQITSILILVCGLISIFGYILVDRVYLCSVPIQLGIRQLIFLLSCCAITTILAANSQLWWVIGASIVIGFPIYVFLCFSPCQYVGDKVKIYTVATIASICAMGVLVRGTYSSLTCLTAYFGEISTWVIGGIYILMFPSTFHLIARGSIECLKHWNQLKIQIDQYEKKFFAISMITFSVLICLVYTHTSAFSTGTYIVDGIETRRYADIIYGYDHSWLLDASSEWSTNDFNIRHPFLKLLTIVPYFILKVIAFIVEPLFPNGYGLLLSIFNMLVMVATAVLLRRITENNWIAPIYSLTYFFIIMCLGMEQYQVSVFLICLTLYYVKIQDKCKVTQSAIWMSGATLTSGHLIPLIYSDLSWEIYWRTIIQYCAIFLGVSGAMGVIPAALIQSKDIMTFVTELTFVDRMKVFTNFVVWQFFSPHGVDILAADGTHLFTGCVPGQTNILGIIILLLCVISVVILRKNMICRICGWSIFFSFILCVALGWAINEAWLYAILFSWAYICLLAKLIDRIVPNHTIRTLIYVLACGVLFLYNGENLREIFDFAINYYPAI